MRTGGILPFAELNPRVPGLRDWRLPSYEAY